MKAVAVARAAGVFLSPTAIEDATHISHRNYAETYSRRTENPTNFKATKFKPSMPVDLEAGRPMELEGIVGGVLKMRKDAGVVTNR